MEVWQLERLTNYMFQARREIAQNQYFTDCAFKYHKGLDYFELVARPLNVWTVGSISVDPWRGTRHVRRIPWNDWWCQWGTGISEYDFARKVLKAEWCTLRDIVSLREESWLRLGDAEHAAGI